MDKFEEQKMKQIRLIKKWYDRLIKQTIKK